MGLITVTESMKSWTEIFQEMTAYRKQAEIDKAIKRIYDFETRAKGDRAKFSAQLNLRTRKMKKIEKVQIWMDALEDQNMHDEAEIAYKRIKELS